MNTAQHETPPLPPSASPRAFNASDGFRVAIYAPRGPRMYLGPRVLLWSGPTWACEASIFDAWMFGAVSDASDAATEVLATFEWNTPASRDRIVEIIAADGTVVHKVGMRANGVGALRLM